MLSRMGTTVKYLVAILILLVTSAVGFFLGHYVADREWKRTYGRVSLTRLSTDLKIIDYLTTRKSEAATNLLDVDMDGNLSWVVEYDLLLHNDDTYLRLRDREIRKLKTYWDRNPPFTGSDWENLRKNPEWLNMRSRHDAFIKSIVGQTAKEK